VTEAKPSDIHGDEPAAASTQGLVDHKELAIFAFQRTRMPIVIADARRPDHPIVLANDAFLTLTGYSAAELVGRNCRLLQGESTSKKAVAEIRAIIRGEREGTVEVLNYRKDGSAFWNQLHLSPIRDDEGRLAYFFASQIDVTEYRKVQTLEEAEHRLLLEVDHRTKNVLAIVDSIVRRSKRGNNPTQQKGFGTVLLGAVLEKQLGGQLTQEWQDQGLRIVIELPSFDRVGASLKSKP
jgi:PAS domain S-box-containing protein